MLRIARLSLALLGLMAFAPAKAATIYTLSDETTGVSEIATVTDGSSSITGFIGQYFGTFTPAPAGMIFADLGIYCIDDTVIGSATHYLRMSGLSVLGALEAGKIAALLANALPPNTGDRSAAVETSLLQMIDAGPFSMAGLPPAATALSDLYTGQVLANVWTATPSELARLEVWVPVAGETGQSFVDLTPIPEPAAIALFGVGLLGLGFVRRRA